MSATNKSRILVIRGGALGDFILTLPALRLLRTGFPEARLEIVCSPQFGALALAGAVADATRSIEEGALASFFSREGDLAPELIAYFGGFDQVISYLYDPAEIFASNLRRAGVSNLLVGSPKISGGEHAARQLARPLAQLGLILEHAAAELDLPGKSARDAETLAIHPGSGSPAKNWPAERFLAVGRDWLSPNDSRRLVLIEGEADETPAKFLRENLPNERVTTLQHLPLPELGARLRACGKFLGHDSGISHLAAAVGTPSLLLFGPTNPAIWAPQNSQVRVLRSPSLTMAGIALETVRDELRS